MVDNGGKPSIVVDAGGLACGILGETELTGGFVGPAYRSGHSGDDPLSKIVDGDVQAEVVALEQSGPKGGLASGGWSGNDVDRFKQDFLMPRFLACDSLGCPS